MPEQSEQPPKGRLKARRRRRRLLGCLAWCGGAFLLLFVFAFGWEGLIALGLVPCQGALPGEDVHPRILAKLDQAGVVRPDERVLYFCSERLFSIESGSLCTDKRVLAYEGLGSRLRVFSATYDEIIDLHWDRNGEGVADTANADSTILVTKADGSWFVLCVTSDPVSGKCEFLEVLRETWEPLRAGAAEKD